MGKVLVIDITKCNGCHNCQIACKDEHCGNDWFPITKPQPLTGQFWTKVIDTVRGTVPKVKVSYNHAICQHCDDAPCIKACPNKAIYKRPDGIVIIDPSKCNGVKECIKACPYEGVVFFNDQLNIAQKCTFCAHLIDKGEKNTRCTDVCPTGAFTFGEEVELKDLIARAEVLKPELGTKPRVYYIGIPRRFIGGTVYDLIRDEVIIGAKITIKGSNGTEVSHQTDNFGDFWIDGLSPGKYLVTITNNEYIKEDLEVDITEKDVNLGDIPMEKALRGKI